MCVFSDESEIQVCVFSDLRHGRLQMRAFRPALRVFGETRGRDPKDAERRNTREVRGRAVSGYGARASAKREAGRCLNEGEFKRERGAGVD